MNQDILKSIDEASKVIGKTWPLYTFVASNPLSGYENNSFYEAVNKAKQNLNTKAFPSSELYNQAWNNGDIDQNILIALLNENGFSNTPKYYLDILTSQKEIKELNRNHNLDVIMTKWLSSFMDEGLAEWEMPYKTEGFYNSWRLLVVYDNETGKTALKDIPKTSLEALNLILKDFDSKDYSSIFTYHLAALPGWTGYINFRSTSNSEWQQEYPIDVIDYLAVRLWTAKKINAHILPEKNTKEETNINISQVQYLFLKAWEKTWQNKLVKTLEKEAIELSEETTTPDAQLVFCIDTRSELIRRHIEDKGNYETFGYAGFFGIAMDYKSLEDGIIRKSCPPILGSAYKVSETPQKNQESIFLKHQKKNKTKKFKNYFLKRIKNMIPSAFGFVEGAGFFYGLSLIGRTLIPRKMYHLDDKKASKTETFCQPEISKIATENLDTSTIPLADKVAIVKSAFDLMGWKKFAPLVLLAGHGSHSANNPFGSSLDCGACAASPGRHNARMLAKLANLPEVRKALNEAGLTIPTDTIFIGAEHNTTTDDIVIFDAEVPESHKSLLQNLKVDLVKAQKTATEDRLGAKGNSVFKAEQKANNWGETRPEWGLAKNAGFIVASRNLTKNTNLESRCFLHSYEWELDTEGKALEGIMLGPMTVTQWINNHYYFSTVDNDTFGGGSKITHNITGKFGVVQGNGGDLKMGLPLQSLYDSDTEMYHQPLRLSVMIQAPIQRVSEIIARNSGTKTLLDNEWIHLLVMDPTSKNEIFKYEKSLNWKTF